MHHGLITSMQMYEQYAVDLAGIHTSWVVPPLLAAFYVVLGSLFVISDSLLKSPTNEKGTSSTFPLIPTSKLNASGGDEETAYRQFGVALAAWGVLAADLQLSATLYEVVWTLCAIRPFRHLYLHGSLPAAATFASPTECLSFFLHPDQQNPTTAHASHTHHPSHTFSHAPSLPHLPSHTMVQAGTPYPTIATALAAASALNWVLFDGTNQGVALAAICAVGAPLSELVLLYYVPLWSYPQVRQCQGSHWIHTGFARC